MKIKLVKGDITKLDVDVIVNAANTSLLGGGGVDGAIHRAGGPAILEDCMKIRATQGGCKTGEGVITTGGNLLAKHVLHTVGPVWNGGGKEKFDQLNSCYLNSLKLAKEYGLKTIAFPNISTGIYKFPKKEAAVLAIRVALDNQLLDEITFCCFDDENYNHYDKLLNTSTLRV